MSGYFNHLSSNAHFANIQADQGFIGVLHAQAAIMAVVAWLILPYNSEN